MERKSSFNMACNLLGQMVKEKRSFFPQQYSVVINGNDDVRPQPPTTLSLFPGGVEDVSETDSGYGEDEKSRLTIFYNRKIFVFDDFPEEKAKDLMQLATTCETFPHSKIRHINCPDLLAQTRRASLHRFLHKRIERINGKAPYQVNGSNKMGAVVKPKETRSWLGLG